jgi:phosphomannomutase
VLESGEEANRNTLIALISAIIAEQHPKSTVVTDSVTSDELTEFLTKDLGLKHLRFRRGYKNVIDKGIELNRNGEDCELAIETSGHGALKENYFSDDGAYLCVKIICKMAQLKAEGRKIADLIGKLGQPAEAREIRFTIAGDGFREYGLQVLKDFEAFAEEDPRFHIVSPNYEGVRIGFDDPEVKGWVLLRMSLHEPKMPMNLEAEEKGGLETILGRLRPFFAKYDRLSGL